jgi:hypothetical protein
MMPTSGKNNALGNQDAAFNLLGQRIKNLRFTQSYVQALADVDRFNFTGAAV